MNRKSLRMTPNRRTLSHWAPLSIAGVLLALMQSLGAWAAAAAPAAAAGVVVTSDGEVAPLTALLATKKDAMASTTAATSPSSAVGANETEVGSAAHHPTEQLEGAAPARASPALNLLNSDGMSQEVHPQGANVATDAADDDFWKPRLSDLQVNEIDDDEDDDDEDDDDDEEEDEYDDDEGDEYEDEDELPAPRQLQPVDEPGTHSGDHAPSALTVDRASDLGEPQVYPAEMEHSVREILHQARTYVQQVINGDDFYAPVRNLCRNKDPSCAAWATQGECEANPRFMNVTCAPLCRTCDLLHVSTRCVVDPNAVNALSKPGDLDRLFEKIVNDPELVSRHQITVLSRPDYALGDSLETAEYQLGMWLIQLDSFASPEECDRLIELGQVEGYVRSADVGEEKEDGTFTDDINSGRTSMNSWCGDECKNDVHAQAVMDRMANVTGIPEANQEHLQLLRYEVGQFYQTHNDYIPYQVIRPVGPRILTFYLYLNDVAEGGETEFPRLGLKVSPKQGRAVLWPSVLNSHPDSIDPRSDHQALPVLEGVKYGANAWIHQREYKPVADATDNVCT